MKRRGYPRWAVWFSAAGGKVWYLAPPPLFLTVHLKEVRGFTKANALRIASRIGGTAILIQHDLTPEEEEDLRQLGVFLRGRRGQAIAQEKKARMN